jgi:deoxyribonuclease-4
MPSPLRIGAHVSVQGGLPLALDRARRIRASALQIFVRSARRWASPPPAEEEALAFRRAVARRSLGPYTLAHASYLINLASPDREVWERSVAALGAELDLCRLLGVPQLVVHPGSHRGAGAAAGLRRVARGLDRALAPRRTGATPAVRVLLENTAGQGSTVGHRFEQLGAILAATRHADLVGVCLDTCHAVAAGYELSGAAAYRRTLAELDRRVGLSRVRAFHLNDSRHAAGSRRDRHAHIGEGHVGLDGFRRLLNDPRFAGVPMVLETPKGAGDEHDRRNLATLRGLVGGRPA